MSTARYITPAERQRLLAQLANPRDRLLVAIMGSCGVRVSEALSLRWRQLVHGGEVRPFLEIPRRFLKGGRAATRKRVRSRQVPLNATAAAAIKEWAFARFGSGPVAGEEPVFTSRERYPGVLSRRQAHMLIRGAARRAGLSEGVAPHSLRRAFAGDVYAATGHDLVATQLLLGHASVLTTSVYLRPRQEELDQIVRNLPGLESGPGNPAEARISPACSPSSAQPSAQRLSSNS